MGVVDRLHKAEARRSLEQMVEDSRTQTESPSSTQIAEKFPAVQRLRGVLTILHAFIQEQGTGNIKRFAWLLNTISDELLAEIQDQVDAGATDKYLEQIISEFGMMLGWVGHGNNNLLPDHLRDIAEQIQPSRNQIEQ